MNLCAQLTKAQYSTRSTDYSESLRSENYMAYKYNTEQKDREREASSYPSNL